MGDLPLVLAGPILRRVDGRTVSVWMALSEPHEVELVVFSGRRQSTGAGTADGGSSELGRKSRPTRCFGQNLYVAVVDVNIGGGLPPGMTFSYDVVLKGPPSVMLGLRDLGLLEKSTRTPALPLGYGPGMLPSFVTPPLELAGLRLVHGSCRKAGGFGPDAMAWLDERIEEGLSSPDRPQQLFLTGDQIYTDEIPMVLLPQLAEIGRELVGPEKLPVAGGWVDGTLKRFPVMRRNGTVRELARFTTLEGDNHLFTFGELAAMYCLSWSPAAWRPLEAPSNAFEVPTEDAASSRPTDWEKCFAADKDFRGKKEKQVLEESERTKQWRDAVPNVARALANIPTFMILDDHDVTDDWNLNGEWRNRVLTAPFGRALIRNAMSAYAVFQGWGNDPAAFRHQEWGDDQDITTALPEEQRSANEKLLAAVEKLTAQANAPQSETLDELDALLGLAKITVNTLVEPAASTAPKVTFHFSVRGPKHVVRVLDSRTRRTFDGRRGAAPALLGTSLDEQLPKGPLADGELLIVVSPVPIVSARILDVLVQPLAATIFDFSRHMKRQEDPYDPCDETEKKKGLTGAQVYEMDSWATNPVALEEMIRRLGTYRHVAVLSGDVHFASSLLLDFWSGPPEALVHSRIVQCTSSALRNQTVPEQRAVVRALRSGQQLLMGTPLERLGWEDVDAINLPPGAVVRPARRSRMRHRPVMVPAGGWPKDTTTARPPDWRWRLEVRRDERPRAELPAGAPVLPDLAWNSTDPLQVYMTIAAAHQIALSGLRDPVRLLVFNNNLGLISVDEANDFRHTLLSSVDDESGEKFTEHLVSLRADSVPKAPELGTV